MSACHVCGNSDSEILLKTDDFSWLCCKQCKYLRLDPMPVLDDYWGFAGETIGQKYIKKMTQTINKQMRHSRHCVSKIRRKLLIKNKPMFLDIGSNIGCMVEAARKKGFTAAGIDFNEDLVDKAKKLYPECDFRCANINTAGFRARSFDVIYSSGVIAQTPDPNVFFRALNLYLKPGGLLYLSTPDVASFSRRKSRHDFESQDAPYNVLYFSKKNIALILNKHKFDSFRFLFSFKSGIKLIARRSLEVI